MEAHESWLNPAKMTDTFHEELTLVRVADKGFTKDML
jgi:hypothetical protein